MRLKRSAVFLLLTAPTWFCAPSALCQGGSIGTGEVTFRVTQGATDMPFTAEMITTQVQTLLDGTQITRVSKRVQMRDSQGRTRTEIYLPENVRPGPSSGDQPKFLTIIDPVARRMIHLDPRQKVATVTHFGPPPGSQCRFVCSGDCEGCQRCRRGWQWWHPHGFLVVGALCRPQAHAVGLKSERIG